MIQYKHPVFSKMILNYFQWRKAKAVTENHSEPVIPLKTTRKAMQVIGPGEKSLFRASSSLRVLPQRLILVISHCKPSGAQAILTTMGTLIL